MTTAYISITISGESLDSRRSGSCAVPWEFTLDGFVLTARDADGTLLFSIEDHALLWPRLLRFKLSVVPIAAVKP